MKRLKKFNEDFSGFEDIYEPDLDTTVPEIPASNDVVEDLPKHNREATSGGEPNNSKNNYAEKTNLNRILPKMFKISNNSVITNKTAMAIAKNLDTEEIRIFESWLNVIESEMRSLKHEAQKKRYYY